MQVLLLVSLYILGSIVGAIVLSFVLPHFVKPVTFNTVYLIMLPSGQSLVCTSHASIASAACLRLRFFWKGTSCLRMETTPELALVRGTLRVIANSRTYSLPRRSDTDRDDRNSPSRNHLGDCLHAYSTTCQGLRIAMPTAAATPASATPRTPIHSLALLGNVRVG